MPFWYNMGFQFLATFDELMLFHDFVLVWLIVIASAVIYLSICLFYGQSKGLLLTENKLLETVWTFIPMVILVSLAIPSAVLLNAQEVSETPSLSFKLLSMQWSWQSEYSEDTFDHLLDFEGVSYLNSIEVPFIAPAGDFRVILTSSDVLHSLGMPSLGIKMDSIPGRLSSVLVTKAFPGWYLGSCYELCGAGHSAMPLSWLLF